jgi:hypothetical protein
MSRIAKGWPFAGVQGAAPLVILLIPGPARHV